MFIKPYYNNNHKLPETTGEELNMNKKALVTDVTERLTKTGKKYWTFKTQEGESYSTFDSVIADKLGITIVFDKVVNGDFLNAKNIAVDMGQAISNEEIVQATPAQKAMTPQKDNKFWEDKTKDIQIGQAMNQAVQIIANDEVLREALMNGDWEKSKYEQLVTGFVNSNKLIRQNLKTQ